MDKPDLKIPKIRKPVSLWVHPEGRVLGSLFLREQSVNHAGPERPEEVLNQELPFIVLYREDPAELRFYNRTAIVRVEYEDGPAPAGEHLTVLPCCLELMDGSRICGEIREILPADRARLFDYLNQPGVRFLRLHLPEGGICLVNRNYVIHVTSPGEGA